MTLFVLAYPNEESERLHEVVETMPINADGVMVERKPERLPKQLSRHLLPPKKSREPRELLKFALPSFNDLEYLTTSIKTSSKIPIVNSKTFSFPTKHHEDLYSRKSATFKEHPAKHSLQPDMRDERHVHFHHYSRNSNNIQQRKEKVYVHNTKNTKD
jgi:hypothetical protein